MKTEKQVLKHRKQTKALWIKACKYDKINPKSSFVIFSKDNPFTKKYNKKRLENNGTFYPGYATQVELKYLEDNGYIYKEDSSNWVYYNDSGIKVINGPHCLEITKDGEIIDIKDSIRIG